jgi:hypothetical protein
MMKELKSACYRKQNCNYYTQFLLLLCIVFLFTGFAATVRAEEAKPGDKVTIVTPGTEARLCPEPGCGPDKHLTRIPEGTAFTIQNTDVFTIGTFKVTWFEVVYDQQRGWISIYDTDKAKK